MLFVAVRVKVPNAFRELQLDEAPVTETVAEVPLTVPASENNPDSKSDLLNVPLPVIEEPDWFKVYVAELSPLKPFQEPERLELSFEPLEALREVNDLLNCWPLQSEPLIETLSELCVELIANVPEAFS